MGTLKNLEPIKVLLGKPETIIFVGSGIPLWSGLPSWSGLIERLAEFCEKNGLDSNAILKPLRQNELLMAASYGLFQLSPNQFGEFLREACLFDKSSPHEIYEKIVKLGPNCFITTNYDSLLEQTFKKHSKKELRVVLNSHLTSIPDVIAARAENFIFKPHGDLSDVDNIVLTQEQYRKILHGDKAQVRKALETLLSTRPILYVGFGLRDPDFIHITESIRETYKGATRDHYAIVADSNDIEADYWHKYFGIRLYSYNTKAGSAGRSDHSELLTVFDELLGARNIDVNAEKKLFSPLALIRHAARIGDIASKLQDDFLPVRISFRYSGRNLDHWKHNGDSIQRFLNNNERPQQIVLVGLPGAGKTFALKKYAADLAKTLNDNCLSPSFDEDSVVKLPLYIDLKNYAGSLNSLVQQQVAKDINFDSYIEKNQVLFIFDSLNEMPREFIEEGIFEKDFADFLKNIRGSGIIVGTRTKEILGNINLPIFELENIDIGYVKEYVNAKGLKIPRSLQDDMFSILRKPLFFNLYKKGIINIDPVDKIHPQYVYKSILKYYEALLFKEKNITLDMADLFSDIAFDAIEKGTELIPVDKLKGALRDKFSLQSEKGNELINWFLSKDFLVATQGMNLSFFHQSITEYMAAVKLCIQFKKLSSNLDPILKNMRWDQALFLSLGMLSKQEAKIFLNKIFEVDYVLGVAAARFVEWDHETIVTEVLKKVVSIGQIDFQKSWMLRTNIEKLPVKKIHLKLVLKMLDKPGDIGAGAVALLIDIEKDKCFEKIVSSVAKKADDYNYCSVAARTIVQHMKNFTTQESFYEMLKVIERYSNFKESHGIGAFFEVLISEFDEEILTKAIEQKQYQKGIVFEVLLHALKEKSSLSAVALIHKFVSQGKAEAVFYLYVSVAYRLPESNIGDVFNFFDSKSINSLISVIELDKDIRAYWAFRCLRKVLEQRIDLKKHASGAVKRINKMLPKIAILSLDLEKNHSKIKNLVSELCKKKLSKGHNYRLISAVPYKFWIEEDGLFLDILKGKSMPLKNELLSMFEMPEDYEKGNIDLGEVYWWLDLIRESLKSNKNGNWFFSNRMGMFISLHTSVEYHKKILDYFNSPNCAHRVEIESSVLNRLDIVNINSFSKEGMEYLLMSCRKKQRPIEKHVFGYLADEKFVVDTLLPIFNKERDVTAKQTLREILYMAGQRHQKRYVVS